MARKTRSDMRVGNFEKNMGHLVEQLGKRIVEVNNNLKMFF